MGRWYKKFHPTTEESKTELRAILNGEDKEAALEARTDFQVRLGELKILDPGRCSVSHEQRMFLERVLSGQ